MIRIVTCLLVLAAAVGASSGAAVSRAIDCQDLSAYFERVDETIIDGVTELIEQPGFRDHFEEASQSPEGFLTLSPEGRESLIQFLRLPGDVLKAIEEDDVPGDVRDLHDSAAAYWIHMADMMEAISEDSPSAAIPYFDRLDAATSDNYTAQQALAAACPEEVDTYAGKSERINASSDVLGEDLFTAWDDVDREGLEGIGYEFLFFATEDEVTDATPEAHTSRNDLATSL